MAPESAPASPGRVSTVLAATVAGVALVMTGASLAFGGGSGLLVVRPIAHPVLYGLIFVVALSVAVLTARGRKPAGLAVGAVGVTMLMVLFALWQAAAGSGWELPDRSYRSPDGRHVLVVDSSSAYVDPIWNLRLEETGGLTARYWTLGFINGDFDLTSVRWVTNNELAVTVEDGEKHVTIGSRGPGPVDAALRSC